MSGTTPGTPAASVATSPAASRPKPVEDPTVLGEAYRPLKLNQEQTAAIHNDPIVKAVCDLFGGSVEGLFEPTPTDEPDADTTEEQVF